jgi:hypothetical protein
MNGIDVDVLLEGLLALVGDVEAIGEDSILAGAAFSGKNGRIAFSAFTPERGPSPDEIFTTNPDGTGERQRTPTTPRAVTRGYSGDRGTDIYVKKLKGGSARRVTNGGYHHEYEPVFSPDGGRIAFTRARFSSCCADVIVGGGEIATVRPDGTDLKVLTHTPDPPRRRARTSRPTGASWCSTSSGPRARGASRPKRRTARKGGPSSHPAASARPSLSSPPTARRAWRTMPRIPIRPMRCGARKK